MRRAPVLALAALLGSLALHPGDLAAQSGTIRGTVRDSTGGPLSRASVTVAGTTLRSQTDDRGEYAISGVSAGRHDVTARQIGYVPQTVSVTLTAGATVTQDFRLAARAVSLAGIDVMVGSRARHTAAEELAVPVDVYQAEDLANQGTTETSAILQALSPSVNFPRQSVTDATDIVRPFTLRGLSPDHTLVLMNGYRMHQTAVVNTFAYGTGAGSSGVDLNTIPSSAIDRIEVLRDGASAQYGSDAIAGVVNLVPRSGRFAPFLTAETGQYFVSNYPSDGATVNASGGWGFGIGRGSLALFGEVLNREPTNRAWADPYDDSGTGLTDSVNSVGQVVVKRSGVPQPNQHWGDGLERDIMTLANLRIPTGAAGHGEFYAFGGVTARHGTGEGYRRYASSERNWPSIYPLGFLPQFSPNLLDYSATAGYSGISGGWQYDIGGTYGYSGFTYKLTNTLNTSLGPCLVTACAPGPDGIFGNADDPGIPNQTSFNAGKLVRREMSAGFNASRVLPIGFATPMNFAFGVQVRRESWQAIRGELASYIDGGDTTQAGTDAPGGSQVFPGFAPSDESNSSRTNVGAYADLEANLTRRLLANVAGRFEHYSDFGSLVTGKVALRLQAAPQLTFRAAASTGFRAPGLGQIHFSKVVTNVIAGQVEEIGVFPVNNPASIALGARPLKQETSVNLSGGLAYTPAPNLTFTADYFYIRLTNRILLGATFDDDTSRAILTRAGYPSVAGVQYFTNGLDTRTQGVDLTGSLRLRSGRATTEFTAAVNYTRNDITHVDPLPSVLANSAETGLIDTVTYIAITKERPDWRGTLTVQHSVGRLRALARGSYYGRFSSAQPGFCDLCREWYGAKTLFDAEVGYRLGVTELSLGARNLLNTFPDQPSSLVDVGGGSTSKDYNNNFGTFPWAAASPFGYNGRYVYARVRIGG